VADVHFYLRPPDYARLRNEVDAVLDRTRFLREHAPAKPAHLGEFGLADEQWRITEEMRRSPELCDVHNALWASALSGASGTALPWWWERIDQHNGYSIYRGLSAFLTDVPWTGGQLGPVEAASQPESIQVVGLRAGQRAWLWLFNTNASWRKLVLDRQPPSQIQPARVEVRGMPDGRYHADWWDTREGNVTRNDQVEGKEGKLVLTAPAFTRDVACKLRPPHL
jgi:hypothetical protein